MPLLPFVGKYPLQECAGYLKMPLSRSSRLRVRVRVRVRVRMLSPASFF